MQQIDATFALTVPQQSKLLAAKPALPGESLASWIQRLSGDHQYSFPRLSQILDFEPTLRDWDLPLPFSVWQHLHGMAQLGQSHRYESLLTLASIFPHIQLGQLRWHKGQYPCTAWCSQCLATDETPYLRWRWRLHASQICSEHLQALSTQCSLCAAPFLLHTSRLVPFGIHGCATTLAECAHCGMLLQAPRHKRRKPQEEKGRSLESVLCAIQTIQGFSNEVAAQRALKYFAHLLPSHCCEIRPSSRRWLQAAQLTQRYPRNASEKNANTADTLYQRQGYERAWLRSKQSLDRLQAAKSHNAQTDKKVHWSWKLGPGRRIQVAKALHLIRTERRELRAQVGGTHG
jgi:hypothetical protein